MPTTMTRTVASWRHYQLAQAITAMAGRLSNSMYAAGIAYNAPGGSLMGKTHQQWGAAADRQFAAIQRLARALRDVDVATFGGEL